MSKQDGGPAFPRVPYVHDGAQGPEFWPSQDGMSLRDYFAAQALTAYISAGDAVGTEARQDLRKAAAWSYEQADAMLKAREAKS